MAEETNSTIPEVVSKEKLDIILLKYKIELYFIIFENYIEYLKYNYCKRFFKPELGTRIGVFNLS